MLFMNCPLTTRILLGQTKMNLPAMVDIAELYYQAVGRKAEKEREREPFDCITRCINIFGFWQRQLNKLSYHHHPLLLLRTYFHKAPLSFPGTSLTDPVRQQPQQSSSQFHFSQKGRRLDDRRASRLNEPNTH